MRPEANPCPCVVRVTLAASSQRNRSVPGTDRFRCDGHKVALTQIRAGQPIVKYGNPIGEATRAIQTGDWVHLHNCRSLHDAGSSVLDLESGVRSGDRYV
jgi:hypothetical protein